MPKNFHLYQKKIAIVNFVEKKEKLLQFFGKICQVFGNFFTFKWQFSEAYAADPSEGFVQRSLSGFLLDCFEF